MSQLGVFTEDVTKGSQAAISPNRSIEVVSCTLADLLYCTDQPIPGTSIKGVICIPEYQRPYVWQERQINRLIRDLEEYRSDRSTDKPLFYLGTIIVHRQDDNLKIIDGQQRITTLLLMESFKKNAIIPAIYYPSPLSRNNIARNQNYLISINNGSLKEYLDIKLDTLFDLNELNVTVIVTYTEDQAYTFFETQNTGGVRLSGADIIKSHHLRTITSNKMISYQASRWEAIDIETVSDVIKYLIKIRYWNNREWRRFPFFRNTIALKETIIDEFSENTEHAKDQDEAHYFFSTIRKNGIELQRKDSEYRHIRQPLFDGNNFMDYAAEYIRLYTNLFIEDEYHELPDAFLQFRSRLLHGNYGTPFLKELFEVALITYVSRFGYRQIFEASLWLYRFVYSKRVSVRRNVREDSVFKFALETKLLDTILESYTISEFLKFLKQFSYTFNPEYTESNQSKGRHVENIKQYFGDFTNAAEMAENNEFDITLIKSITQKTRDYAH